MKPLCLRLLPVKPFLNVTEGEIIAPFDDVTKRRRS